MNDYNEQLLEGTPNLTPEEIAALEAEQQDLQTYMEVEQPKTVQPQVPATAVTPTQPTPQKPSIRDVQIGGELETFAIDPRGSFEAALAIPTSIVDTAVDALNLIPNVSIPKIPKFESDITQSVREISSIIIPTIALGGMGSAALASKAGQLGNVTKLGKFLNSPFIKHIGDIAFKAGTGAAVDYAVELNQQDDNLSGTLRKTWPRWWGWIPEDIATLDSDSPEVKRNKNVTEGASLGVGSDLLLGLNKFYRGLTKFQKGAPVPKTEKAGAWFARNVEIEGNVEDVVEASAAKRFDALDEVGSYNVTKAANLDEPIFGYHDLYGYQEQGIRSVDDLGIVGASIDAARIADNIETIYGRIGNAVSEGALKYSLEGIENQQAIQKGLADVLTEADEYGYRTALGRNIESEQIKDAGERLAATFYEMDVDQMRAALVDYQRINTATNATVLSDDAYKGVVGALKKYMNDFVNMDYMKAQSYVGTSFAGQISDMAQGMRLTEGTPAIERAQEQILDRMEFLMVQKNMTSYSNNRFKNLWNIFNKLSSAEALDIKEAKRIEDAIKGEADKTAASFAKIKDEAKFTVDNLREISQTQPEMLEPLLFAYELTDGNVDTITKLNNYLKQSTGVLSKAFIDGEPEIPSALLQGFYANVYNGTLGAFGTPIKAGLSATAQLIEKPLRTMAGGLLNGDLKTVRRGWYQYSSVFESLQDSFGYMKQVFKRSGMDPTIIKPREEYGVPSRQLELINSFANAKAAQGDYGPQYVADIANNMKDLGDHPWFRFGNRSMQAFDGFTQSMVAMSEAKGRVFDELTKGGKVAFDKKIGNELYKKVYKSMFDDDGLITDSAVLAAAGEISLNLDNQATTALSNLIKYVPVLKPFLLFTKTPINELKLSASYNPLGLFVKDMNAFKLEFDDMPFEDVETLLAARGIEVDPITARSKYNEIRADLKGRKAFGALAVSGGVGLFLNDSLTGNGLYDKEKQALRRAADWKPRSIRVPGGEWVSYDNLGPITTWLSLTADIMDNGLDFGLSGVTGGALAPNEIGENLHKMAFVLGAAITDKTALAGLEPLMDILNGNTAQIAKWSSSFLTSAAVPGSNQLAEIARLLDPGLKEVEMNVFDLIRNRMPGLKSTLPASYDWIDGGEVGVPDNNFARIWNTYMPWKVSGKISPEKQFLMDIEYDARPTLSTDGSGVRLTTEERSEITNIMGRDGLFKQAIQRVMKTTDGKAFRKRYKEAVANGLDPDLSSFETIHLQLDRELRNAMSMAKAASPHQNSIARRAYIQETTAQYLRRGDQDGAQRFLDYMKQFSY